MWGHIDGSVPAPQGAEALSKWEIHDAQVMTWLLSSVESHLVLNLRPYKTAATMCTYLNTIYNQDNSAKRFHLEYEWLISHKADSLLRNIFLVFKLFRMTIATLFMLMFPTAALSAVREVHSTASEINS